MAIVMKNIFKYILAAAAVSFAATACVQEEAHTPGEPEVDGCYGVYFPAQETDIILDPSDPTTYTIKAVRKESKGDINVPLTVVSETDVISVGDLAFENGQAESTITLDFSKSEVGVTYSCTIKIEDPQYASKYSVGSVAIDFQFCREKWNELGKVAVSEYYLWGIEIPSDHEAAAILYQNDLNKNLFRLENPFAKRYTNDFTDGDTWFTFRVLQPGDVLYKGQAGYETKITMSDLVYFDDFNTGFTHPNYGAKVLMCHPSGFNSFKGNQDEWAYSCVSQYQADGTPGVVEIGCLYYMDGVGGMNGSQELCMKIVFPGFVETDYSLEMEAGLTFDGAVPVAFYTGVDAAKIRFKAYEGRLNTAEKNKYIEALIAGTEEGTKEIDAVADDPETEEAEYAEAYLELAKTGVYTLVAATVDAEGNGQEGDVIEFTYVAPEDEEENAVVISCGVSSAEGYRDANTDNTISFYVYGDNITEAKIAAFSRNDLAADVMGCINKLITSKSVSDEVLAAINGDGYFGLATKLLPGTQYFIAVYATNGYCENVFLSESSVFTTGDPLPVYQNFTYKDYADELEPASEDVFIGSWNLYAMDLFGSLGLREYIGQAVISDSEFPDEGPDEDGLYDEYLTIKGLSGPYGAEFGFDDALTFDLYGGLLFNASTTTNDEKTQALILTEAGKAYQYAYQQYFIPVMDGYYALVASSGNYEDGFDVNGIGFYNGGFYSAYCNYLIVDPTKDDNGLAPAPSAKVRKEVCKVVDEVLSGIKVPYRPIEKSSDIKMYDNIKSVEGKNSCVSATITSVSVEKASKSIRRASDRKIDSSVNRF